MKAIGKTLEEDKLESFGHLRKGKEEVIKRAFDVGPPKAIKSNQDKLGKGL